MQRKILASFGLFAILMAFLVTGGISFAAASPKSNETSSINIATLQKSCKGVLNIHLNGLKHTVTCRSSHKSGVRPNIGRDNTCLALDTVTVFTSSGLVCFNGSGYLGVSVYNVNEVIIAWNDAWIRYYSGGSGSFCSLKAQSGANTTLFGNKTVYLTQINSGNTNGYRQCPLT